MNQLKYSLIVFCLGFSLSGMAQSKRTEKTKILRSDFQKAKTIYDLIPAFPKDCKVTEFKFILDVSGSTRTITVKNDVISNDLKSVVNDIKAGENFFIEHVQSDCKTAFKKNYIFIVL